MRVEVNLREATLGEVMEKLIRKQLGVHSPIVMLGTRLLYETGEDLEAEEVAFYKNNLGKVLLPNRSSSGPHPCFDSVACSVAETL